MALSMNTLHHEDHCARCYVRRTREIDTVTKRCVCTIASACPTKDACEAELMAGFTFERGTDRLGK